MVKLTLWKRNASSPLFHPDGTTAISSISNTERFIKIFVENSTFSDSGFIPPSPPHSNYLFHATHKDPSQ